MELNVKYIGIFDDFNNYFIPNEKYLIEITKTFSDPYNDDVYSTIMVKKFENGKKRLDCWTYNYEEFVKYFDF